jgi:Acetyltransferase (GNAT) domain
VLETLVHASDEIRPIPTEDEGGSVRRVDPLGDPGWDGLLAASGAASFFHGAPWARVLRDSYGFSPVYFVAGDSSRMQCLLPVMEVDSRLTGRRGVSLPFTDECEPAADDADSFRRLFGEAVQFGRDRSWKYLEVRGGRQLLGDPPASTSFFGHSLDLRGGESAMFSAVDPAARRAVRKAEQGGLTVEFSRDLASVQAFYALLCKTRRRLGVPPQPFRFFTNLQRHVLEKGQGWVVLARLGSSPVAGAVFLHMGKTAMYKYGASDESFQHLRPNNLVMWEAIKFHSRKGFELLDFGRTSISNEGLRRFKLSWATTERRIDYVRYDLRRNRFVTVRDGSSGWQTGIFRILPSSLARLIGAAAYKHIA